MSPQGLAVYRAAGETAGVFALYRVPLDRSQAPVRINATLPRPNAQVGTTALDLGGEHVVFLTEGHTANAQELYAAPLDGSGAALRLNPAFTQGLDVLDFAISADGTRVVYRADALTDEVFELFSVPIAGGTALRLNGPLVSGGDVVDYAISGDGERVVYRADQDVDEELELYSVPLAGGSATQVSAPLVSGGDVRTLVVVAGDESPAFGISPDGARVVYVADQEVDERHELYSAPIAGGAVVRLNPTLVAAGDVRGLSNPERAFAFSPDATRVLYLADQNFDERLELFSVPIAGGAAVRINEPLDAFEKVRSFAVAPDASRVLYLADQLQGQIELWSAPLAGGSPALRLNSPGQQVQGPIAVTGSGQAVYRSFPPSVSAYSVPVDGSAAPLRLNPPLDPSEDVASFTLTPDGERVLYLADHDTDFVLELWSVPTDGSATAVKLNAPLPPGGSFELLFPLPQVLGRRRPCGLSPRPRRERRVRALRRAQRRQRRALAPERPARAGTDRGRRPFLQSRSAGTPRAVPGRPGSGRALRAVHGAAPDPGPPTQGQPAARRPGWGEHFQADAGR